MTGLWPPYTNAHMHRYGETYIHTHTQSGKGEQETIPHDGYIE